MFNVKWAHGSLWCCLCLHLCCRHNGNYIVDSLSWLREQSCVAFCIVQAKPFLNLRNNLLDIKALVKDFYDLPQCCSFSVQYQESDLWLALVMVSLFSKCYAQHVVFSSAVDGSLKSACDALMTHMEVTGVWSVALTQLFVRCLCHGDVGSCKRV